MVIRRSFFKISIAIIAILYSCDIPKDPNKTFSKAKGDTLRVGIANSGARADFNNGKPKGIEVEIIKGFAESINTEIKWIPGSQQQIIDLLKEYQLDIAIGGFTKGSAFKKHAGFTNYYERVKIKIGAPAGVMLPSKAKNEEIAVKEGTEALAAVKKKNGIPVIYDSIPPKGIPLAATEKDLEKLNYNISKDHLQKSDYVIAIPKGENKLLQELENYLQSHVKRKG